MIPTARLFKHLLNLKLTPIGVCMGFSAPLPTDADFSNFASNHYKSPIDLVVRKTDRLTKFLSSTKAQAKNECYTRDP